MFVTECCMFMSQQRIEMMMWCAASMRNENVFNTLPKWHMQILLGDFNVKIGTENIPKPTTGIDFTRYK